ncbi:tetraspanin tsp2 family [Moniliophthora roreri MCA 2997]|uniref:Tetraspanin tsp2 family n=1 Tax=Moniliophthora roreri (strain MCA 2997) TaxID=1381753 RepID=V2X0H1_MONRO|nr:tetraspanin tsp2 family [Moniliophthora roreri MCA 2997]
MILSKTEVLRCLHLIPLSKIQLLPREALSESPLSSELLSSQSSICSRRDTASISLSVDYLSFKFPEALLAPKSQRQRGKAAEPKRGGGIESFRSGGVKMPEEGDEECDGISGGCFGGSAATRSGKLMKWNEFKWILFIVNALLSMYSLTALVFCLLT